MDDNKIPNDSEETETSETSENIEAVADVEDGESSEIAEADENSENSEDTENSDESTDKAKQRKAGWFIRDVFEWGETLVSAVIIIVVIFTFVVRVTSVEGESMIPTLRDKDMMLVENFFYTPKHNDIVVIFAPNIYCCSSPYYCNENCRRRGGMGKDIIKRVIGVEGDTIRISPHNGDGLVYRNGEPLGIRLEGNQVFEDGHMVGLESDAVNYRNYNKGPTTNYSDEVLEETVPKGYIFVLGDNRGRSKDSRYTQEVGLVDLNTVAGRAFFRVAGEKGIKEAFGFVD